MPKKTNQQNKIIFTEEEYKKLITHINNKWRGRLERARAELLGEIEKEIKNGKMWKQKKLLELLKSKLTQ